MALTDIAATTARPTADDDQQQYARVLARATRLSLAVMGVGFLLYAAGWPPPLVPMERLPEVWSLPVSEYLRATGVPTGWAWLSDLGHGDLVGELGVAMLALCSAPSLIALVPLYRARGDRVYAALCAAQASVMALSASGLFSMAG